MRAQSTAIAATLADAFLVTAETPVCKHCKVKHRKPENCPYKDKAPGKGKQQVPQQQEPDKQAPTPGSDPASILVNELGADPERANGLVDRLSKASPAELQSNKELLQAVYGSDKQEALNKFFDSLSGNQSQQAPQQQEPQQQSPQGPKFEDTLKQNPNRSPWVLAMEHLGLKSNDPRSHALSAVNQTEWTPESMMKYMERNSDGKKVDPKAFIDQALGAGVLKQAPNGVLYMPNPKYPEYGSPEYEQWKGDLQNSLQTALPPGSPLRYGGGKEFTVLRHNQDGVEVVKPDGSLETLPVWRSSNPAYIKDVFDGLLIMAEQTPKQQAPHPGDAAITEWAKVDPQGLAKLTTDISKSFNGDSNKIREYLREVAPAMLKSKQQQAPQQQAPQQQAPQQQAPQQPSYTPRPEPGSDPVAYVAKKMGVKPGTVGYSVVDLLKKKGGARLEEIAKHLSDIGYKRNPKGWLDKAIADGNLVQNASGSYLLKVPDQWDDYVTDLGKKMQAPPQSAPKQEPQQPSTGPVGPQLPTPNIDKMLNPPAPQQQQQEPQQQAPQKSKQTPQQQAGLKTMAETMVKSINQAYGDDLDPKQMKPQKLGDTLFEYLGQDDAKLMQFAGKMGIKWLDLTDDGETLSDPNAACKRIGDAMYEAIHGKPATEPTQQK